MITCPSCNHQNPEGSLQCENCYTPLPANTSCPNCGASVQTDATFCGQCGFNLQAENPPSPAAIDDTAVGSIPDISFGEVSVAENTSTSEVEADILPETSMSSPIVSPWDEEEEDVTIGQPKGVSNIEPTEMMNPISEPDLDLTTQTSSSANEINMPWEAEAPDLDLDIDKTQANSTELETTNVAGSSEPEVAVDPIPPTEVPQVSAPKPSSAGVSSAGGATQLQIQTASLLHLQSNTNIELPDNVDVVHLGKPNGQIPPDIDVAGFPDSEVVSRVHADIRIEGDAYYIEDMGSSNGTYVNHAPLLRGNRHRLRPGDRVALGKGDLVTFIFQLN